MRELRRLLLEVVRHTVDDTRDSFAFFNATNTLIGSFDLRYNTRFDLLIRQGISTETFYCRFS